MKKMIIFTSLMMVLFVGCEKKETEEAKNENNIITEVTVEETSVPETTIAEVTAKETVTTAYVSPEYLEELEYNSQKNVYFGES